MTTVRSTAPMAVPGTRPLTIVGRPSVQRVASKATIGQQTGTQVARRLHMEDGQDLNRREIPPVRWVIQDLLPEGANILAGKPKKGKSFLSMEWALDVVNGTPVFGQYAVEQGEVIYLNLDDPSVGRLQARQRELLQGRVGRGLMWVVPRAENPIPKLSEGLLDSLDCELEKYPSLKLVIIDTWGRVSRSKGRGEDWYMQDVAEISHLQYWAHRNHVAVLAIHHMRKTASDEELDSLLGSIGISGTFDNILALKRTEKKKTATLYGRGRDYKDDVELTLSQEDSGAWALPESKPVLTLEKQAIVDLVLEKGSMSARDIADTLEKGLDGIQKHLLELRATHWLDITGSGKNTMWTPGLFCQTFTDI